MPEERVVFIPVNRGREPREDMDLLEHSIGSRRAAHALAFAQSIVNLSVVVAGLLEQPRGGRRNVGDAEIRNDTTEL